ncbi:hypothetical protein [Pseudonocardia sp. GCM10023141]|uniref:hypothetical protein n=1 Tax=Pseudonocardia sp. GCM10023141 TaxID=3252653 RepID=UPI003609B426
MSQLARSALLGTSIAAVVITLSGCTLVPFAPLPPPGPSGGPSRPAAAVQVASIPLTDRPSNVAISPDGRQAWVAGDTAVTVIDTAARSVLATISLPETHDRDVAFAPDGRRAYVSAKDGIAVIDTAGRAVVGEVDLGGAVLTAESVVVTPDGRQVFAAGSGEVVAIDAAALSVTGSTTVDRYVNTMRMAMAPDGRTLIVTTSTGAAVLDTATRKQVDTVGLSRSGGSGVGFAPDGQRAYLSDISASEVVAVDGRSTVVQAHVPLELHSPGPVTVSPDSRRVFVGGYGVGGAIFSVIDAGTDTVLAGLTISHQPRDLALTADGGLLYATDWAGRTVSVLDVSAQSR